jgi:hypothetical protein
MAVIEQTTVNRQPLRGFSGGTPQPSSCNASDKQLKVTESFRSCVRFSSDVRTNKMTCSQLVAKSLHSDAAHVTSQCSWLHISFFRSCCRLCAHTHTHTGVRLVAAQLWASSAKCDRVGKPLVRQRLTGKKSVIKSKVTHLVTVLNYKYPFCVCWQPCVETKGCPVSTLGYHMSSVRKFDGAALSEI